MTIIEMPIFGHQRCRCGAALGDPATAHNRGCEVRGDFPTANQSRPLRLRERLRRFGVVHEAWAALKILGLRDRLRCPSCRAVGTWKPHGTIWDRLRYKDRPVRRWMCKWCGRYEGPEGLHQAFPDPVRGAWALPRPIDPESPPDAGPTPADTLFKHLPKTWPWWG